MTIDLVAIVASFAVIFLAELPDKSMFASVVLATRFRPLPVWIGLAAAFFVHGIIAVTAGRLVTLLPHRIVAGVVTVLFIIGAVVMFLDNNEQQEGEVEAQGNADATRSTSKIIATAFGIIFVSEWGDLTQLAAITLTARYHSPLSVLIGTVAALWAVCGLGVLLGKRLAATVPLGLVKKGAGFVLAALAVWSAIDFIKA